MDAISDQRMKEIEEEMNRFENEIASSGVEQMMESLYPPPATFPLISQHPPSQHPPSQHPPSQQPRPQQPPPQQPPSHHNPPHQMNSFPPNQQPTFQPPHHLQPLFQRPHHPLPPLHNPHMHMQNPPRPPPHLLSHMFNQQSPFNQQHMFPPMARPPQLPFSPMFIPPQLRNRPIIPPPRPPISFGQGQNPLPHQTTTTPPSSTSQTSISAPKVIYSAPPVKNKTPIIAATNISPNTSSLNAVAAHKTTPTTNNATPATNNAKSSWKRVGESKGGDDDDDISRLIKLAKMEQVKKPQTTNGPTKQTAKTTTTPATTKTKTTTSAPITTPTTTPSLPSTTTKPPSSKDTKNAKDNKKKKFMRMAAGSAWEDTTLNDWDTEDFRIFCGDLGNEVTDDVLIRVFNKYPSFQKARVIRDKRTNKTKGYGFASFKDPNDFMKAIKEVNGRYVGNRPIKLKKSCWQDRQLDSVKKREKEKKRLGYK